MADATNLSSLVLICDACRHVEPAQISTDDGHTIPVGRLPAGWPTHCDRPMRLANTTDRDGALVDPEVYESELP